jgi:homoaconitase/3-isopropylmalate dehydratase large subunit
MNLFPSYEVLRSRCGRTLVDKTWDQFVITQVDEGLDLLHLDRHCVHDVTSPKAFSDQESSGWHPPAVASPR